MPVVEFSFPDKDLAEASQIAQELRRELSYNGIPPQNMALVREDPETMSIAAQLAVSLSELGPALVAMAPTLIERGVILAHVAAIAHTVYEVCIREHCAVHVKTPRGVVQIGPGEVELDSLRTILRDAFDVDAEP